MKIDLTFFRLPQKQISLEAIENFLKDEGTKRIHFATTHAASLKEPKERHFGKIIVPFSHTIGPILSHRFEEGLQDYLFLSKFESGGYWRGFKSTEEYDNCKLFIDEYNEIVFLRDTLDLSLALSMNFEDDQHTVVGELEYQAKFQNNRDAENKLVEIIREWIQQKLPYYSAADAICAMPCSEPLDPSLPRRIVDRMDKFENISSSLRWKNKDKSLKELGTVEEKIAALKEFELQINSDLSGKNVILLDDLYMSGISMQFVAMKMKEAGAKRIFGISIVKSRSNTAR